MEHKRSIFLVCFILLAGLFAYNWYANEVTIEYENGTYKGEASLGRIVWNGVPHGQGTYTSADGAVYVGEFKDGKQNGQGTLTSPDGSEYVGEYKNDNPWNGTEYDKDGTVIATYSEGVETKI